jgi:hypothetical protein
MADKKVVIKKDGNETQVHFGEGLTLNVMLGILGKDGWIKHDGIEKLTEEDPRWVCRASQGQELWQGNKNWRIQPPQEGTFLTSNGGKENYIFFGPFRPTTDGGYIRAPESTIDPVDYISGVLMEAGIPVKVIE